MPGAPHDHEDLAWPVPHHEADCYGDHDRTVSCEQARQLQLRQSRDELWQCQWAPAGHHRFIVGSDTCINGSCDRTYAELHRPRNG